MYIHAVVSLLCLTAFAAAQSSDECQAAILIPPPYSNPLSVFGSTTNANASGLTPCDVSYDSPTPGVYYEIQPQEGSSVTVTLCSSDTNFDTELQVFGSGCSTCVVQNDDFCSVSSQVTFTASESSYFILVTGYNGDTGSYEMTVSENVASTTGCDNATPIPGPYTSPVSVFGNTQGKDTVNGLCNLHTDSPADWYQIFPTVGNEVHISTCNNNTDYDTVLAVVADCHTMQCVVENDDNCSDANGLASSVSFLAEAASYYVFVAGYSDNAGSYIMTIAETESGGACNQATPIPAPSPGTHVQFNGELVSGTEQGVCFIYGYNPVWYKLQGAIQGAHYNASTCNEHTSADTVLAVVSGTCGSNQTCVVYNDDNFCNANVYASSVNFTVTDPANTYIVVMSFSDNVGSYVLTVASPTTPTSSEGSSCTDAVTLLVNNVGSVYVNGSLPFPSASPSVNLCALPVDNSQYWYKLDGIDSGMGLEVSTCSTDTDVDTTLYVVSATAGTCGPSFYCIANNDDDFSCLLSSLSSDLKFSVPLDFDPIAKDMFIVVSEYSEIAGSFGLTVTVTLPII